MGERDSLKNFSVTGKVQGVYFRKTFLFACHKRKLSGAVTNDSQDPNLVHCSVRGDQGAIQSLLLDLKSTTPLNSLGAHIDTISETAHEKKWEDHDYGYQFGLDKVIKPPLIIKVYL